MSSENRDRPGALLSEADVRVSPRRLDHPVALLSLDLETDFGTGRDEALSHTVSFLEQLAQWGLPLTAFVEGQLFEKRPALCQALIDHGVDVQLHVYDHSTPGDTPASLRRGVEAYAAFVGRPPEGYRAHTYRLTPALFEALLDLGFRWDASLMRGWGLGRNSAACFRRGDYLVLHSRTSPSPPLFEFPMGTWRGLGLPFNHPYSLLVGTVGGRVLKGLGPSGRLVSCNVHMTDLWRSPALADSTYGQVFAWMQRWMWLGHGDQTLARFRALCEELRGRGFGFKTMAALHREVASTSSGAEPPY